MGSRERLAQQLCRGWFGNGLCVGFCHSRGGCAQALETFGDEADAILSSDWLRDTLAAERERCAKAYEAEADTWLAWPQRGAAKRKGAKAIRNLEPEASDEI